MLCRGRIKKGEDLTKGSSIDVWAARALKLIGYRANTKV